MLGVDGCLRAERVRSPIPALDPVLVGSYLPPWLCGMIARVVNLIGVQRE